MLEKPCGKRVSMLCWATLLAAGGDYLLVYCSSSMPAKCSTPHIIYKVIFMVVRYACLQRNHTVYSKEVANLTDRVLV